MPNEGQGQDLQKADVKQTAEATTSKATDQEALKTKDSEPEVDIDETDLKDVEEGQKVPYSRFKQANEKAKERDRALETYKAQTEAQHRALVAEIEALRVIKSQAAESQDTEDDGILDLTPGVDSKVIKALLKKQAELEGKLTNLTQKTSQDSLRLKVDEAIKKFPKANKLAVMGILKHDPSLDVEEIAEDLHNAVMAERTEGIKELIERKRKKATEARIPLAETGMVRLKDSEKPKSVKEATEKLRSFLGKLS